MNKFLPASAWRKRAVLAELLFEIHDLADSAELRLKTREFDRGNLPYCLNQLQILTKKANKFYKDNK